MEKNKKGSSSKKKGDDSRRTQVDRAVGRAVEFASGYTIIPADLTPVPVTRTRTIVKTVVKEPPSPLDTAIEELPSHMRKPVRTIVDDPELGEGVREMVGRSEMSPLAALLSGLWLVPQARRLIDAHLDRTWEASRVPRERFDEVVIGGGLQAAIYCAVRVSLGFPRPLVLERSGRVGGVFAVTHGPGFFLNSRNRPGGLSVPGQMDGSLNFLPNGPVQPSHLSGDEYQTNDVMAWAIRMSLAMNAKVVTNMDVTSVYSERARKASYYATTKEAQITIDDRAGQLLTGRAILADGLATPRNTTGLKNTLRVMTFEQFMARMDSPFPLRGMDRVAVLGGGDGGKTAIESLTGKGPARTMSVAALDWPRKITWFGAPQTTRQDWEKCNRSRYLRIGSLLTDTRTPGFAPRVEAMSTRPNSYAVGYECVYVDDVPYDYIIDCTGYGVPTVGNNVSNTYVAGERVLAMHDSYNVFRVGVAGNLELTAGEAVLLRGIQENKTSAFRYASRTALLAASLPLAERR